VKKEKVPCDGCICLPICLNKIRLKRDNWSSAYYYFDASMINCSDLDKFLIDSDNFNDLKFFYLKLKGYLSLNGGYCVVR
jgi:hypothetical protein